MDLPVTKKVAMQQIRKYTPHRVNVQAFILLGKKVARSNHEYNFVLPKCHSSSPVLYLGQIVTFKDVQDLSYKVAVFCLLLGDSDI